METFVQQSFLENGLDALMDFTCPLVLSEESLNILQGWSHGSRHIQTVFQTICPAPKGKPGTRSDSRSELPWPCWPPRRRWPRRRHPDPSTAAPPGSSEREEPMSYFKGPLGEGSAHQCQDLAERIIKNWVTPEWLEGT